MALCANNNYMLMYMWVIIHLFKLINMKEHSGIHIYVNRKKTIFNVLTL